MKTTKEHLLKERLKVEEQKTGLSAEEKKRLTDFFALLMEIDTRTKRKEVSRS